jgi:hypothetical protein
MSELDEVREINSRLPFADPIALTVSPRQIAAMTDFAFGYKEIQARRRERLDEIAELTARTGGYDGDPF